MMYEITGEYLRVHLSAVFQQNVCLLWYYSTACLQVPSAFTVELRLTVCYTALRHLGQDKCWTLPVGMEEPWILSAHPAKYRSVFIVPWRSTKKEERKGLPLSNVSRLWGEKGEMRKGNEGGGPWWKITHGLNLTPPTLHLRLMQAKVHTLSLLLRGNAILI